MSNAMRRGLARLMLRWPEKRAELVRRAQQDARFCELCEAYESACEAIEYWTHSSAPTAEERAAEYRALASATEHDILDTLS
jgi:hypothetical protein